MVQRPMEARPRLLDINMRSVVNPRLENAARHPGAAASFGDGQKRARNGDAVMPFTFHS